MEKKDRRYWDSNCFLGWLQSEPDKAEQCKSVLEEADKGNVLIVTSALTLAEVIKLRGQEPILADRQRAIVEFFKSDFIAVVNVTRFIAERARELVWINGIDPKDAIHVATALDVKLLLFNTFDEGLLAKSKTVGDPPLRIEKPSFPNQMNLSF